MLQGHDATRRLRRAGFLFYRCLRFRSLLLKALAIYPYKNVDQFRRPRP
jgi:hypothetical protein